MLLQRRHAGSDAAHRETTETESKSECSGGGKERSAISDRDHLLFFFSFFSSERLEATPQDLGSPVFFPFFFESKEKKAVSFLASGGSLALRLFPLLFLLKKKSECISGII